MDASILRAVAENASRERGALVDAVVAMTGRDDERGRADAMLSAVLPIVANARVFAASLEQGGKPRLPSRPHVGAGGAVRLRLGPRGFTTRALLRNVEVAAVFDETIRAKSDVEARRDAGAAASSPASIVLANGLTAAIEAVFTTIARDGIATVEVAPNAKLLEEILARVFAPIVAAGLLAFTAAATEAKPEPSPSPILVMPYLYGSDELAYQSKDLAASVALADVAGEPPTEIVVAHGWPQRARFLDAIGATSLAVVDVGSDDPIAFLRAATDHVNAGEARSARLVVHPAYDDDRAIGAALEDAIAELRPARVAVNAWPALLHVAPLAAALRLEGVAKLVLRAPLLRTLRPAHFRDRPKPLLAAARLVDFALRPSLVAALRS